MKKLLTWLKLRLVRTFKRDRPFDLDLPDSADPLLDHAIANVQYLDTMRRRIASEDKVLNDLLMQVQLSYAQHAGEIYRQAQ